MVINKPKQAYCVAMVEKKMARRKASNWNRLCKHNNEILRAIAVLNESVSKMCQPAEKTTRFIKCESLDTVATRGNTDAPADII